MNNKLKELQQLRETRLKAMIGYKRNLDVFEKKRSEALEETKRAFHYIETYEGLIAMTEDELFKIDQEIEFQIRKDILYMTDPKNWGIGQ
jgi:hypothetical protein